jgi:hypothetical protein
MEKVLCRNRAYVEEVRCPNAATEDDLIEWNKLCTACRDKGNGIPLLLTFQVVHQGLYRARVSMPDGLPVVHGPSCNTREEAFAAAVTMATRSYADVARVIPSPEFIPLEEPAPAPIRGGRDAAGVIAPPMIPCINAGL